MARVRTGAASYTKVITAACRFSRMPGFAAGLAALIGQTRADTVLPLWIAFCAVWDAVVADDTFPFQKDYIAPIVGQDEAPV